MKQLFENIDDQWAEFADVPAFIDVPDIQREQLRKMFISGYIIAITNLIHAVKDNDNNEVGDQLAAHYADLLAMVALEVDAFL